MENPEVAQVFEEVADLLEIQGSNPFRVRADRNAARTIRDLSESLAGMSEQDREALPGIGKDLAGMLRIGPGDSRLASRAVGARGAGALEARDARRADVQRPPGPADGSHRECAADRKAGQPSLR